MNIPFWSAPVVVFGPGCLAALVMLVMVLRAVRAERRENRLAGPANYIPGSSPTAVELNCEASLARSRDRRHG